MPCQCDLKLSVSLTALFISPPAPWIRSPHESGESIPAMNSTYVNEVAGQTPAQQLPPRERMEGKGRRCEHTQVKDSVRQDINHYTGSALAMALCCGAAEERSPEVGDGRTEGECVSCSTHDAA